MSDKAIGLRRYFIELSYLGTAYHGWQIQKNALSVQEFVDRALSTVFNENIETLGCGRTDTGVHARQLYAHFDSSVEWSMPLERYVRSINALLPKDISCKNIFEVHPDAHARFDANSRAYEYHMHFEKDPFLNGFSWQQRSVPDVGKMNAAAGIMMEYQDFQCFSKSHTQVNTFLCIITKAEWVWDGGKNHLIFYIEANRFLRNMVRAIVGTLLEIGTGKKELNYIREVIESKNRSIAGASVPACGLYLTRVTYPFF